MAVLKAEFWFFLLNSVFLYVYKVADFELDIGFIKIQDDGSKMADIKDKFVIFFKLSALKKYIKHF